ncbi:MAG: molybdopterin synthase sulfur carrier subunit [Methyloprofundus sp.]|nr:molybdopterin synthase sulfur carrier subunit [Methyloprofundus sp.]
MAIKIRYFASLKETVGRESDCLEFEQKKTVAELWAIAVPTREMPANTLAAVNMEYVALEHQVVDGDEVAFFPPVTGG